MSFAQTLVAQTLSAFADTPIVPIPGKEMWFSGKFSPQSLMLLRKLDMEETWMNSVEGQERLLMIREGVVVELDRIPSRSD